METHGIKEPRLAVTELQMFAHLGRPDPGSEGEKLSPENMVNPSTLAEALYDTLVYHAAVRLQPFVALVTHSATVNHGGGLRKERERVYANPCYYANLLFANFAEATPLKAELQTPQEQAPFVLPDIKNLPDNRTFGIVDAVAALNPGGDLLVSLVHRGDAASIRITIELQGFTPADKAQVDTLSGPKPWSANTLAEPHAMEIRRSEPAIHGTSLALDPPPCSVVQCRFLPRR
jgi:alpha-N-arabinofuranosidase